MEIRHKILVLDDDVDWLNLCNEMFAHLPSKPEIRTVASGARALALMETEPFRLLVCDLKMPRMDGLQVLSIVRRRFPELRTVVLSGLEDEEFRSRAYALGVDLFWLKTDMQANSQMFLDCIESLMGRDMEGGFRGRISLSGNITCLWSCSPPELTNTPGAAFRNSPKAIFTEPNASCVRIFSSGTAIIFPAGGACMTFARKSMGIVARIDCRGSCNASGFSAGAGGIVGAGECRRRRLRARGGSQCDCRGRCGNGGSVRHLGCGCFIIFEASQQTSEQPGELYFHTI